MKIVYSSFIRSIMEYGSIAWMGAADSHLDKLDRVQQSASRVGRFEAESLQARRNAAAVSFALRMLSGSCKGVLCKHTPKLVDHRLASGRVNRHSLSGIQIKPLAVSNSLNTYIRGFHGILPTIWAKLPQSLILRGYKYGWSKIKTKCASHTLRQNQLSNKFRLLVAQVNNKCSMHVIKKLHQMCAL